MENPLVSIIVTTKNSAETLNDCLLSVKNQSYKYIELIVVDNNSSDSTEKIAKTYTKLVFKKGPERSSQRNLGIQKSKGTYLLFLDSDMHLSPKVVEECVKKIGTNVALYIPEIIAGDGFWAKMRTYERSFYNKTVIDAVRFCKKTSVGKIGGFDETLFAGEDWDFNLRIQNLGKTGIINSPLFHIEKSSLVTYLSKKSYYSNNLELYQKKWVGNADVAKQFDPLYRLFGVFIENGKWKKIVVHPILFLCVIMLKFFVGLQFLFSKRQNRLLYS